MDVTLPNIIHATRVYEEGHTLHVVTDLMHFSDSLGFDRQRHDEMMDSVARFAILDQGGQRQTPYINYVIHSPDQP